jgi:hypothetical protein
MLWKSSDGGELPSKKKRVIKMDQKKQNGQHDENRNRPPVDRNRPGGLSTSVEMVVNWKPKKQKQPTVGAENGNMLIVNPLIIPLKGDWFRVNGTYKGKVIDRIVSPHKFKPWTITITLGKVVEIKSCDRMKQMSR